MKAVTPESATRCLLLASKSRSREEPPLRELTLKHQTKGKTCCSLLFYLCVPFASLEHRSHWLFWSGAFRKGIGVNRNSVIITSVYGPWAGKVSNFMQVQQGVAANMHGGKRADVL